MKKLVLTFQLVFCFIITSAQALKIAVAANAQFVIQDLQSDFKKKTGIDLSVILGSSGKLSAQIRNGAPYDVFLSADMEFPNQLFKDGFAIQKPKTYALGSLIICSTANHDLKNWKLLITKSTIKKIAIANPALAPYGQAAREALQQAGLWKTAEKKMVFGESISQVNTYLTTGAADLAFTTAAFIKESPDKNKLHWVKIDERLYQKIEQGAVVLNYAKKRNLQQVIKFYDYLSSPSAKRILEQNGYKAP